MSLRKQLLNLLFPPRCPFCNQPLHDAETGPCPTASRPPSGPKGPRAWPGGRTLSAAPAPGGTRGGLRDSLRRFKFSGQKGYAATYGPILAQAVRDLPPRQLRCAHLGARLPRPAKGAGGMTRPSCWPRPLPRPWAPRPSPLLAKTGHNAPQSSLTQGSQRRSNVAGCTPSPSRRRWAVGGCW